MIILGDDLANKLVSLGFNLEETKQGALCKIYYFTDTPELEQFLVDYSEIIL